MTILSVLLLFAAKTKPEPLTFPLDAQVKQASLVNVFGTINVGSDCGYAQHLTGLIDGKHCQLNSTAHSSDILQAGHYQASVQKEDSHGQTYNKTCIYRLLSPSGKSTDDLVVGEDQ